MVALIDDLTGLEREALAQLSGATDEAALEAWRVKYLGRNGALTEAMKRLGTLAPEERREAGRAANLAKDALEAAFSTRQRSLHSQERMRKLETERVDVTLPGYGVYTGQLHPITQIRRDVERVFMRLGFSVVESPEVEWDLFNFTMLNMPPNHPARDIQDTFYVANVQGEKGEVVLRTHTSPGQIRTMLGQKPPIRVLIPGRCYRNEATDPSHESRFQQVEGLAVDEKTSMAELRGALTFMIRALFGPDRVIRFRCGYFPFVEPGAEFDMSCHVCDGSGCRVCKHTGWIEIGGCGMVHPIVLENCGLDPSKYSGWAFGFGFERMAMLRYDVDDIRLFYQNDLRFLEQFK
jgi:phenylalanyl-tRNA synthetase alpha chain